MTCPPSLFETRLCQRPGKLGLKDVFIFMKKGVLLYSNLFQNKFSRMVWKSKTVTQTVTKVTATIRETA